MKEDIMLLLPYLYFIRSVRNASMLLEWKQVYGEYQKKLMSRQYRKKQLLSYIYLLNIIIIYFHFAKMRIKIRVYKCGKS